MADEYYGENETAQVVIGGGLSRLSRVTAKDWSSNFGEDVQKNSVMQYLGADGLPTLSNDANISEVDVLSYIKLNGLAQALYSLILTDLGQSVESNILTFPQRVIDFANKTMQLGANEDSGLIAENRAELDQLSLSYDGSPPSGIADFYKWFNTSIPYVNASVISTQYVCQVPELRSIGSVVVSVVVADLVLLQAL